MLLHTAADGEPEDGSGPMGVSGLEVYGKITWQATGDTSLQAEGRTHMLSNGKVWTGLFINEVMIFPRKHTGNHEWENKTENMKDEMFLGTSLNINHQKYEPTVRWDSSTSLHSLGWRRKIILTLDGENTTDSLHVLWYKIV